MSSGPGGERLNLRIRVLLSDGATSYQASTIHVSASDAVVTCRTPITPGKTVDAVIVLPGGAARVRAEVTWVRDAARTPLGHVRSTMGLRFVVPPGPTYDAWFATALARSVQRTLPPPVVQPAATPAAAPAAAPAREPRHEPGAASARPPAHTVRGFLKLSAASGK